jgi:hypothetical protein
MLVDDIDYAAPRLALIFYHYVNNRRRAISCPVSNMGDEGSLGLTVSVNPVIFAG